MSRISNILNGKDTKPTICVRTSPAVHTSRIATILGIGSPLTVR